MKDLKKEIPFYVRIKSPDRMARFDNICQKHGINPGIFFNFSHILGSDIFPVCRFISSTNRNIGNIGRHGKK
jgi:hypothetical protein